MAPYALTCESTVDLDPALLEELSILPIFFNYQLGGVNYKDDFWHTMKPGDLYSRMLAGEDCTTSQVSVGEYLSFWRPLVEQGQTIVHVSLSSGISGTYESACMARDRLRTEHPTAQIYVVDSLCASAGYGLLVTTMALLRAEGMGAQELATWGEEHRLEIQHWFMCTDLRFFIKGGRISKTAGTIAGALKICPLLTVEPDGSLGIRGKERGKRKVSQAIVAKMRETVTSSSYDGDVYISHSDCQQDARMVASMILEAYPKAQVHIFAIGATVGVHTGPGTVAVFWHGVPRTAA